MSKFAIKILCPHRTVHLVHRITMDIQYLSTCPMLSTCLHRTVHHVFTGQSTMSIGQLWTSSTFPTSPMPVTHVHWKLRLPMDIHHPQCPCRIHRTVQWNPTLTQVQPQFHCLSYPTVPCRIAWTVHGNPLSHSGPPNPTVCPIPLYHVG